jgi:hypothetical protein
MMPDTLRPWIARVAGVLVSGLLGWLFTSKGIETPTNVQGILQAVVETVLVMLAGYVLTHISTNKVVNPIDAAGKHEAAAGKEVSNDAKVAEETQGRYDAMAAHRDADRP